MKTHINCTSSQLEANMGIAARERNDFQLRLRQRRKRLWPRMGLHPEPQLKINALARGNLHAGPETNPMMRPRVKGSNWAPLFFLIALDVPTSMLTRVGKTSKGRGKETGYYTLPI